MILVQALGTGLLNGEVLLADMLEHRADVAHRRVYVFFHYRPVDTAACAGVHFDKAFIYFAASYITQCVQTVFCAVDCYGKIAGIRQIHAVCNTACNGKTGGSALEAFTEFRLDLNAL